MKKLLAILCGILFASTIHAQDIYIQSGKIVDTKNGKILTEKTIIVSGERIKSVEDGYIAPKNEGDTLIDLREMTVLPGLTDMHVHMESESNPGAYLEPFTLNDADVSFNSLSFANSKAPPNDPTVPPTISTRPILISTPPRRR